MRGVAGQTSDLEGAEQALERLHHASYAWALLCCRWDRELALDVLQSAYLKLLDGRAAPGDRRDPRAWVFGIIRRTASEHRRRNLARVIGNRLWLQSKPQPSPPMSPEDLCAARESRSRLRLLLGRLSSRQRRLLHLVFYEDMTIEDASAVMGISVGAGRQQYARGKARLRKFLSEERVSIDVR